MSSALGGVQCLGKKIISSRPVEEGRVGIHSAPTPRLNPGLELLIRIKHYDAMLIISFNLPKNWILFIRRMEQRTEDRQEGYLPMWGSLQLEAVPLKHPHFLHVGVGPWSYTEGQQPQDSASQACSFMTVHSF